MADAGRSLGEHQPAHGSRALARPCASEVVPEIAVNWVIDLGASQGLPVPRLCPEAAHGRVDLPAFARACGRLWRHVGDQDRLDDLVAASVRDRARPFSWIWLPGLSSPEAIYRIVARASRHSPLPLDARPEDDGAMTLTLSVPGLADRDGLAAIIRASFAATPLLTGWERARILSFTDNGDAFVARVAPSAGHSRVGVVLRVLSVPFAWRDNFLDTTQAHRDLEEQLGRERATFARLEATAKATLAATARAERARAVADASRAQELRAATEAERAWSVAQAAADRQRGFLQAIAHEASRPGAAP